MDNKEVGSSRNQVLPLALSALAPFVLTAHIHNQPGPEPEYQFGGIMSNAKGKYLATVIAIAMILLSVTAVSAQRRSGEAPKQSGKPRVVVIGTGSGDTLWTTNITTASLEDALSQGGRFELITAAQRDKILSEQGFNNSDLVDPKQATRVGKLLVGQVHHRGQCA